MMGNITHMHELLIARNEQDGGMRRRMSGRRDIVYAGRDFTTLLNESGLTCDWRQVSRAAEIVPFLNPSGIGELLTSLSKRLPVQ